MPLWTFFGLRKGKATTPWPLARWDATARKACSACRATTRTCARPAAAPAPTICPTEAITMRAGRTARRGWRSTTDAASSASSAPKRARRTRWRPLPTGPSASRRREDSASGRTKHTPTGRERDPQRDAFRRSLHIRHVDAGSCNGCESELQALNNPFYNLHRLGIFFTAVAAFRRSAAGHRPGHARHA